MESMGLHHGSHALEGTIQQSTNGLPRKQCSLQSSQCDDYDYDDRRLFRQVELLGCHGLTMRREIRPLYGLLPGVPSKGSIRVTTGVTIGATIRATAMGSG